LKLLKRIAQIIAKVLLGIVLVFALMIGVLLWQSRNVEIKYEKFSVLDSGDGRYILTIETGNPTLPYGPHSVVITVTNASGSEVIVAKKARLANDGARINSNNISIRWIDTDTASVCIRGDEQRDAYILIDVPNQSISERPEQC
jgi:hypothetical protein